MPSNESATRRGGKMPRTQDEMRGELDELRDELQNLTSSVKAAAATPENLESTIRNNPFAAIAIAAGIGFLYAVIRR
jgi:ElaB/YqjD/DUF883 family membrane-anchored ribosome-binding protein